MNRNFSKTILQLDTGSGRRPLPVRSPNMTEFKPDLPFSISSPTASLLHLLVEDGLESKRSSAKRWRREAKRSGTWIWALDPRSTLLVHLRDVHNRTSHSSCSRAPTDYISQSVGWQKNNGNHLDNWLIVKSNLLAISRRKISFQALK